MTPFPILTPSNPKSASSTNATPRLPTKMGVDNHRQKRRRVSRAGGQHLLGQEGPEGQSMNPGGAAPYPRVSSELWAAAWAVPRLQDSVPGKLLHIPQQPA